MTRLTRTEISDLFGIIHSWNHMLDGNMSSFYRRFNLEGLTLDVGTRRIKSSHGEDFVTRVELDSGYHRITPLFFERDIYPSSPGIVEKLHSPIIREAIMNTDGFNRELYERARETNKSNTNGQRWSNGRSSYLHQSSMDEPFTSLSFKDRRKDLLERVESHVELLTGSPNRGQGNERYTRDDILGSYLHTDLNALRTDFYVDFVKEVIASEKRVTYAGTRT